MAIGREYFVIEDNLKKAELILDVYNKFGQIGIWYCDKISKNEEVSKEWAGMLGYEFNELNPMSDEKFRALLHPDDIEHTRMKANRFYSGDVAEYNNEFRLKHKDGHYVWILSKAEVHTWQEGKPRLVIGTHINIDHQKRAFEKVKKQNSAILSAFSKVIEFKDEYTKEHLKNVAHLAMHIGVRLELDDETLQNLHIAAKLHDLGKIQLPLEVLNKPGKLTEEEYELVKRHSSVGYELLQSFDFGFPLAEIVKQHHERMDGSGYPSGLKGDEILYLSQIIAVADIADAMLSNRPYRKPLSKSFVIETLSTYSDLYYPREIIEAGIEELRVSRDD